MLLSDTESVTESTLIDNIENKIKEVSLSTEDKKNNSKGDDEDQNGNITYDEKEIAKADDFKNKGNVYY